MTPILGEIEDDLNFRENGRRPHSFGKWKTTQIFENWKTTSILEKMKDDLIFFVKVEGRLNFKASLASPSFS